MFLQRNAKPFTWPSPESTCIEARLTAKRPVRRRIRHFRHEQANGKSKTLMACLKVMYKKRKNKKLSNGKLFLCSFQTVSFLE